MERNNEEWVEEKLVRIQYRDKNLEKLVIGRRDGIIHNIILMDCDLIKMLRLKCNINLRILLL